MTDNTLFFFPDPEQHEKGLHIKKRQTTSSSSRKWFKRCHGYHLPILKKKSFWR